MLGLPVGWLGASVGRPWVGSAADVGDVDGLGELAEGLGESRFVQ